MDSKTLKATQQQRPKAPKHHADPFAWLSEPLDRSAKSLLRNAARLARAFNIPDNKIQPEFIFAAALRASSGPCKAFTSYLAEDYPELPTYFTSVLADIYEQDFPSVSDQLQTPTAPRAFAFSKETQKILQTTAKKWRQSESQKPIPVDYILATIFHHTETLDILDQILFEFGINRFDLFDSLSATSTYFTYSPQPSESTAPQQIDYDLQLQAVNSIESFLKETIIGQPLAIERIMFALRRAFTGFSRPNKPIGTFLFAGSTGVGKTKVAYQLSAAIGIPKLRLDMSEYAEKHTASRLFGAPPGYVGYQEGGQLTNFVRQNPSSIIIFDEIEKAHPDVFDSLLQITEEGTLTDGQGKIVNFHGTIIIITTNIGAREANKSPIGFDNSTDSTAAFDKAIKNHFKPELLARIGRNNTVIFDKLSVESLKKIALLELIEAIQPLEASGIYDVIFAEEIIEQVVKQANADLYGARDIIATIDDCIVSPLSDLVLTSSAPADHALLISYKPDIGYSFEFTTKE